MKARSFLWQASASAAATIIVVSMGYDYNGKRIRQQQKTVPPPAELTPRQVEKWLNEQAVLFGGLPSRRSPSSSSRWQNTSTCG